mgnify:FL=1
MCGNTQIQASNIHTSLNAFETKDPASNKTGLQSQFEVCYSISYCNLIGHFVICNHAGFETSVP